MQSHSAATSWEVVTAEAGTATASEVSAAASRPVMMVVRRMVAPFLGGRVGSVCGSGAPPGGAPEGGPGRSN
jgi:hypothetical protein